MSKSVLHTIEVRMAAFSKGQKRIAHYILDHYDQAAFMTASKLGKLTEVSESTVVRFAAELGYEAGEQELTMLTQFYVGVLVSIVEDWLLGEIQGTPEELSRFVDQVLRDHVRGAGLRLSQAGPGAAPLLEPDHCAGPVSK